MNLKKYFFNVYTFNLAAAVVVAIVLIILTLAWLKVYTHHGQQVAVPNVKGLSLENAVPLLMSQRLHYEVVDSIYVKNKPAGSILETVPPVGTHVKEGRTIYLTLNAYTAHLLIIPQLPESPQLALQLLGSIGFDRISTKTVPGSHKDLVVALENNRGQRLSPGDRLPANTPLVLLVCSGYEDADTPADIDALIEDESPESWY